MSKYAQYPGPVTPQAGDLALLSRSPHAPGGTHTYDPSQGLIPLAAQMTISTFETTWVGQIDPLTFWPPWNMLDGLTSPGLPEAFNPDGIASLAVPVLPASSPPGPTWPGFFITVPGIYKVLAYINMVSKSASVISPAIFNTFITTVPFLFPTGAQTLTSDSSFSEFSTTGGNSFANCNVEGMVKCLAGDAIFVGINDSNSFGANNNVAITNDSYFGIYRVR